MGLGLLCGAAIGAVFWGCLLALPPSSAPSPAAVQGRMQRVLPLPFLPSRLGGLKHDLEVRCWGSPVN